MAREDRGETHEFNDIKNDGEGRPESLVTEAIFRSQEKGASDVLAVSRLTGRGRMFSCSLERFGP